MLRLYVQSAIIKNEIGYKNMPKFDESEGGS